MSLVKLSPPMGMIEVYQRLPRSKMATSVVPAPMSIRPTPSSFSSWVRTEAAVAIWLRTICSISISARSTQVLRFWTEVMAEVTMWTLTSSLIAAHAQRGLDPVLLVDHELLGDDVDDLPVGRDGDGLGLVDDPADVLAA